MKNPRMSTLVERAHRAASNVTRLTAEINYHDQSATELRRQRNLAKQRLERAQASIAKLAGKCEE